VAETTVKSDVSVVIEAAGRANPNEQEQPTTVEVVIHRQLPWIRWRLRSLFPSHLDLDELEQQVLLNMLRSWPTYRGEGSVRAWVDRIVVRVGLKHARRVRSRERSERAMFEDRCDAQQYSTAEAYFAGRQLKRLLSALPSEQARALVLRFVVGLKVSEIASQEGVPTETARSRLRVGMQKLRRNARFRYSVLR
jgi:RNA polymerase sigma-70 factor (ECF subfamily)